MKIPMFTFVKSNGNRAKLRGRHFAPDHKVTHFLALITRRYTTETFLANYSETMQVSSAGSLSLCRLKFAKRVKRDEIRGESRLSEVECLRGVIRGRKKAK